MPALQSLKLVISYWTLLVPSCIKEYVWHISYTVLGNTFEPHYLKHWAFEVLSYIKKYSLDKFPFFLYISTDQTNQNLICNSEYLKFWCIKVKYLRPVNFL